MHVDRLVALFGPVVLDMVDDYDLTEESDRMDLVRDLMEEPDIGSSSEHSVAMRSAVVAQVLQDDPPDTWRTVQRLLDGGLAPERVLSQVSMVVASSLMSALDSGSSFDLDGFVTSLDQLPLPTTDRVATAIVDVVRAQQGIAADEVEDRVVAELAPGGSDLVERMLDRVFDMLVGGPLEYLPGDGVLHIPSLVDGRTFTRRHNESEAELELLSVGFDLGAFSRFDVVRLPDGTELEQSSVERNHLNWRGADGWLSGFEPGDLLAVTATVAAPGGGVKDPVVATVRIERVADEPPLSDEVVRAVRAAYDEIVAEPGLPVSGEDIQQWLCFHHPELTLVAQRPLSELCEAAGLEQDGGQVAHSAEIWRRERWGRRYDDVLRMTRDDATQRMLGRALDVLDDPHASIDDVRACLAECATDAALDVLADVLVPHALDPDDEFERGGAHPPAALFDLVARATAVAARPAEVTTAEYLACVLWERCGEPLRAEEHLGRAAKAGPLLGPIVERMGWYLFDRGDVRGALRWWRQLSEPHPAASVLESLTAADAGRRLGRNDPCWCGSGRKFKQCHLGVNELPALPDRVAWLCRKATLWIEHATGDQHQLVADVTVARAAGDVDGVEALEGYEEDEIEEMFERAVADPIVFDTALHEGRLFSLFLRERGALLPEDELLLAQAWLTVDRSVHEVVEVVPGSGLTLRDLATGDVVAVRERTASRRAQVGERICARVVPDGAGRQIIGGVFGVRTGHEEDVLALCERRDPFELVAWAGAIDRPPTIVHRPGMLDSMIDRDALDAAMAGVDGADGDAVIAALTGEITRQMQTAWLDESVPALRGLTPRQAAADPTHREQLERLLDEFDRHDGPGGYDTDVLRRQLGLD